MSLNVLIAGILAFFLLMTASFHSRGAQMPGLPIACPHLTESPTRSWPEIRQELSHRPQLSLGQSWLVARDPQFAPASAAAAWDEHFLYIYADLEDRDIFNPSQGLNQPAYQKGDIFEILVLSEGGLPYFEFHITPHSEVMQLRFPHRTSLAEYREAGGKPENLIDTFKIEPCYLQSHVEIHPAEDRWTVVVKIPAGLISPKKKFLAGDRMRFSFCRYDYTRGQAAPVLSSTSPYTACSFHRQEEWLVMVLE